VSEKGIRNDEKEKEKEKEEDQQCDAGIAMQ
jgi:hypothetical protein